MAPPALGDMVGTPFEAQFSDRSVRESRRLAEHYQTVAADLGASFFDTGTVIEVSSIDAIHFDAAPQAELAKAIAEQVRKLV